MTTKVFANPFQDACSKMQRQLQTESEQTRDEFLFWCNSLAQLTPAEKEEERNAHLEEDQQPEQ